jgi:hypothetical protein
MSPRAVLPDVEEAHCEWRADPFVQVEADEIGLEVAHLEIELPPRMGRVDDGVDLLGLGHAHDLGDWHDEARPVAGVGEQQEPRLRVGVERPGVGIEHGLPGRRLRHVELDDVDAAPRLERVHRILHRIVVEIGVEHGVAGLQPVVAADEKLQCFGRAARERDLLDRRAHGLRHLGADGLEIRPRVLPPIVAFW